MDTSGANPQSQPAIMVIVGSVIAAASTALLWMKLEAENTPTVEAKGLDLDAGSLVIVMAVVAVILAIIQLRRGATGRGRGQAIANIVMTAFIVFASLWVIAAPGDVFAAQAADEVAAQLGISESFAEEAIKQGVDAGEVDVSTDIGSYVGLVGGLIALAGAILGTIRGKKVATTTAPSQPLGSSGPGAAGPGTPPMGGSTPADATGTTTPPPGAPTSSSNPPQQ